VPSTQLHWRFSSSAAGAGAALGAAIGVAITEAAMVRRMRAENFILMMDV